MNLRHGLGCISRANVRLSSFTEQTSKKGVGKGGTWIRNAKTSPTLKRWVLELWIPGAIDLAPIIRIRALTISGRSGYILYLPIYVPKNDGFSPANNLNTTYKHGPTHKAYAISPLWLSSGSSRKSPLKFISLNLNASVTDLTKNRGPPQLSTIPDLTNIL
jgi:hypothetical protein